MKDVYLTTKTIQIKPYTKCSVHQLGLDVGALHLLFSLFYTIKKYVYFTVHKQSHSAPVALFMKFPTCAIYLGVFKDFVICVRERGMKYQSLKRCAI